jgi:predicted extracellular nuclease
MNHFIAFWNLENLFAPEGCPGREPKIARATRSDLEGWSKVLFNRKIDQLVSIIRQMNDGNGPDILGVCQVENKFAMECLSSQLNSSIANRAYSVVHADSTKDQRGIDTAFVYDSAKYQVDPSTIFSYFVMRRTGTRDITQATFKTSKGNELIALCNHWPSRSGNPYFSRGYRMTAGETLSYWLQRIWEEKGKEIPIIVMGDFNDDPFDESVVVHAQANRDRGDVERAQTVPKLYNLSWRYMEQQGVDHEGNERLVHGTLYFNGNGNIFDQLLVSKGLMIPNSSITVKESTAKIEIFPEMVDHRVSYGPIRFGLPKGNVNNVNTNGFSDHFPVSVVLLES